MSRFIGSGGTLSYTDAHCGKCFMMGHELAHPELGCADVGCNLTHPEPPRVEGRWTQPCSDNEHERCSGFVGGPAFRCTCRCHPELYDVDDYTRLVVASFVRRALAHPRRADDERALTDDLMTDLRDARVLRGGMR